MKNSSVATATDDGVTVSSHFGRAPYYEVVKLSNGSVVTRERRDKAGHHTFVQEEAEHGHDHGESHERRHQAMVSSIADCQAVIVRGMGQGAVNRLRNAHLISILTSLHTIEEVIVAMFAGSLDNDPRHIHQNHG